MTSPLIEGNYPGEIVHFEQPSSYSRTVGTIKSGVPALKKGALLGKRTKSSAIAAAAGGNAGNGAIGAVTLGALAQVGVYTLRCIAEASNGGTFAVFAPDGSRLADLTVAVAYAGAHINLTVADGSEDWNTGEVITVTVSGDGKYDYYKAGDVTGLADAAGVLLEDVDASAADKTALILNRDAIVTEQALIFHSSVDDSTKRAAAKASLLANTGIKTTTGV